MDVITFLFISGLLAAHLLVSVFSFLFILELNVTPVGSFASPLLSFFLIGLRV